MNVSPSLLEQQQRPTLVAFDTPNRAHLVVEDHFAAAKQPPSASLESSMPPARKRTTTQRRLRRRRTTTTRRKSTAVRVVKGRVHLRVAGHVGVAALSPSALIRHIPAARLRLAARKVLKHSKVGRKKVSKRRGRKGRRRRTPP